MESSPRSGSRTGSDATLKPRANKYERVVLPVVTSLVLLNAWALAVHVSGTKVFPSPAAVGLGLVELIRSGLLASYLQDSLLRVLCGFVLAAVCGLPLGMTMGLWPALAEMANPVLQVIRPISPIAWIPIAILLFGISNPATIFLIFLASFPPITLATMNAAREVPEIYLRAGRNFGLSRGRLLRRIIFPAALPGILVGLRISLGLAWIVLVAAEMIAVDSGLGYLIVDARNAGKRYDLVVAGMLLIGLVGLLLDVGMRRVERMSSVRWAFRQE